MTLTARVSLRAMSALTLRREKLKLERRCCSNVRVDERVGGGVEHARLAEGARSARYSMIGVDALLRVERDAREEVQRAVLAEHVAPADLEERARRDVEPLGRDAALGRRDDDAADLDAAAVADRRRRRLLDRDQQIARRLAAVAQLGDARAAEQAERGQPPLALVDRAEAERIAGLDLQLALDRRRSLVRTLPTIST